MPRLARAEIFSHDLVATVHVMARVVRRCFMLGTDSVTGKNYDHRKVWIEEQLIRLAADFGIDLLCFSILSNHFHLVLRSRPDVVANWNDTEVAQHWLMLCPIRKDKNGAALEPNEFELNSIRNDPDNLAEVRKRLSNIAWWMRLLCQNIQALSDQSPPLESETHSDLVIDVERTNVATNPGQTRRSRDACLSPVMIDERKPDRSAYQSQRPAMQRQGLFSHDKPGVLTSSRLVGQAHRREQARLDAARGTVGLGTAWYRLVFFEDRFSSVAIDFELPSVRLVRAEVAIGSYREPPIETSSPLALCQRKHVKAELFKNVASARMNRAESSERSVAICVAANCGPTGIKPAETTRIRSSKTTRDSGTKVAQARIATIPFFNTPALARQGRFE